MLKIKLTPILPKGVGTWDTLRLMRTLENSLDACAAGARVDFQATVETWDKKPEFKIGKKPLERTVYTENEIYAYVNDGTRPHTIQPKNPDGALVFFKDGFKPKTRVKGLYSNKGRKADKNLVFLKHVDHPGTEARNYDVAVEEKWQKRMVEIMQRSIDSEFSRVQTGKK